MPESRHMELARYRIEKAQECLEEAYILHEKAKLTAVANRSYYAIFHAMRAVLAMDGLDYKKHSAVIAKFRELYIKTKKFDLRFSKMIGSAFDLRTESDYEDFFLVEKEEIEDQLEGAKDFIVAVESFLDGQDEER